MCVNHICFSWITMIVWIPEDLLDFPLEPVSNPKSFLRNDCQHFPCVAAHFFYCSHLLISVNTVLFCKKNSSFWLWKPLQGNIHRNVLYTLECWQENKWTEFNYCGIWFFHVWPDIVSFCLPNRNRKKKGGVFQGDGECFVSEVTRVSFGKWGYFQEDKCLSFFIICFALVAVRYKISWHFDTEMTIMIMLMIKEHLFL